MDKADLCARIAQRFDTTVPRAERIVDATLELITEALGNWETVKIRGFGTFQVRKWATGPVVIFTASRNIKQAIRKES